MEENINYLYEDVKESTKNIDLIINELANIKESSLCVGCGGSKVVAEFINLVLTKKNNIICKTIEPRSINYLNLNLYKNIIAASYSGSNFGIKNAMNTNLKKYLLTSRASKINDEVLLHYNLHHRHSFISLNTTIVPMAIMLKYYLGAEFDKVIEDIFTKIQDNIILSDINNINIFTGDDTLTPTIFLESTLIESGIGVPIIHFKYDYCHGRSTINKSHDKSAIFLENKEEYLDELLKSVLDFSTKEVVLIKGICDDEVINNFYMTLQCLYLLKNIAKKKKIDLSNINYDKDVVKKVYYFKGSM